MATSSREQLKAWFSKGKKPLASQFASWIDSFWHKNDSIPMSAISGLLEALNQRTISIDAVLSELSTNPVQNKIITEELRKLSQLCLLKIDKEDVRVETFFDNHEEFDVHGLSWLVGKDPTSEEVVDYLDALVSAYDEEAESGCLEVPYSSEKMALVFMVDIETEKKIKFVLYSEAVVVTIDLSGDEIEASAVRIGELRDHTHSMSAITGLADALSAKANAQHVHPIDSALSDSSNNPVKNKVVKAAIDWLTAKYQELVAAIDELLFLKPITYAELKELRDNGELRPGRRYRITDFITTTTQTDTRSAGHRFDIIVVADSANSLNEEAHAVRHNFTEEEMAVPTYYLWTSENSEDYGIITRVRVPQSIEDIVGRYTNDGEEYISDRMLNNYTELSSADEDELLLNWLYANEENPDETDSGTDTYSFAGEITLDEVDSPTYFANSKLKAWKLKYCLDNDITRFAWADTDEGKGVIYYLEDEFGNVGGYDFKNILKKRYRVTDDSDDGILGSLDGQYVGFDAEMRDLIIEDYDDYIWAYAASRPSYTFNEDTEELELDMENQQDATLNLLPEGTGIDADGGGYAHPVIFCKGNKFVTRQIGMCIDDENWVYPQRISDIVLYCLPKYYSGDDVIPARIEFENCADNVFATDSDFITANGPFSRNTFLTDYTNIIFGSSVGRSTFMGDCHHCTFGGEILRTTFGGEIWDTTFGGYIRETTFGGYIGYTTFGGYIGYTTFGGYIDGATFGGDIGNTTFGGYIGNTTFGGYIWGTTFGGEIWDTTFGGYILDTTFGGGISNTTFGGYIYWTTFGGYIEGATFGVNIDNGDIHGRLYSLSIGSAGETWTNLVIDPGVEYVSITCTEQGSSDITNVHIFSGICGTDSSPITITIPSRSNALLEVKPDAKEEIII